MDRRAQAPVSPQLTAPGLSRQLARSGHRPARPGTPGYRVAQRFGGVQVDFLGATSPEAEQHEIQALARTCAAALGHHVTEITVYGGPGLQVRAADQQQEETMTDTTPADDDQARDDQAARQEQMALTERIATAAAQREQELQAEADTRLRIEREQQRDQDQAQERAGVDFFTGPDLDL